MNYEKPNVALVASAIEAVKGQQGKDTDPLIDAQRSTVSAYEADE